MTYAEITQLLSKLRLDSTADSLARAVRDEANALAEVAGRQWKLRRDAVDVAAAEDFYAEDITRELAKRRSTLKPEDILHYRRTPTAWAIAQMILREDPTKHY